MPETNTPDPRFQTGFDYYAGVAKNLHDIADRLAALADLATDGQMPPRLNIAHIFIQVSGNAEAADRTKPVVDILANLFEAQAKTESSTHVSEYKARTRIGNISVTVDTSVPRPETKRDTTARLRAENDRLRAEVERLRAAEEPAPQREPALVEMVDKIDGHADAKTITRYTGGAR
ncbi:hypothetical protein [Phytohabitans aurantiacus]|uniref:Uncharacterized protein n=1 Tax=Phytohabitans aurantiacus TaxID=3016789 RepID=A0ABQ5QT35_9ACTN|nr:hypothetical protein [Phytohabitans aurantiacus]GLH97384.1 hypothetical protein Pa4123_26590 [Phytohabitans aurantiacus]